MNKRGVKALKYSSALLFVLLFTFLSTRMMYLPWVFDDEKDVVTAQTWIKRKLNTSILKNIFYNKDYIRDNFLLVNITNDYATAYADDSINTIVITDREKLTQLFNWLHENKNAYNIAVCNVLFDENDKTKFDDSLSIAIDELQRDKKIIFARAYDKATNSFIKSGFPEIEEKNSGAVNKDVTQGYLFKYQLLYEDRYLSLPLHMYKRIYKRDITTTWFGFLNYANTKNRPGYFYNSYIPEMLFTNEDFDETAIPYFGISSTSSHNIAMIDLGQAVRFPYVLDDALNTDKNIFIGAFTHNHADMHQTLYGTSDGSIILLNIYYSLVSQANRLWLLNIIFLVAAYSYMAYFLFIDNKNRDESRPGFWNKVSYHFHTKHIYLLLLIVTLLSYFIFSSVLNIIVLEIMLGVIQFLSNKGKKYLLFKTQAVG